jgi:hypothetical protein
MQKGREFMRWPKEKVNVMCNDLTAMLDSDYCKFLM